jgi:hypothetical protein
MWLATGMNKRVKIVTGFVLSVALFLTGLFLLGHVGSSANRIEREHGLRLPPSARRFACRGNAWMHSFSDCDAVSVFEIASNDVTSLVSQLEVRDVHEGDFRFPMDSQYEIHRPWMSSHPWRTYRCKSPINASELDVQIWQIDDAHAGILLYTDWN